MHRAYMNRIPGQHRIHIELTHDDIKDLLNDLTADDYFAPTESFLEILRTAHEAFAGVRGTARTATGETSPKGASKPAAEQPAEARPAEARPPREQWHVQGYDADEWNAVSCTFSRSEDAHARKRVSQRYPDMPTRVVRETTTWTVEATP